MLGKSSTTTTKTNKILLTITLTKTMVKARETNFAAAKLLNYKFSHLISWAFFFSFVNKHESLMNKKLQKSKLPFNQGKIANKAIAIQKDSYKTQREYLDYSQIDIHDQVLKIFKVLLPFLILILAYLTNQ